MADMVCHRHEDSVSVLASCGRLHSDLVLGLALQNKDACLNADAWLERVWMQIETCQNLCMRKQPFADIAKAGRSQNSIGQYHGDTPGARFDELDAALDEEDFRRLGFLNVSRHRPRIGFCIVAPRMAKVELFKDCGIIHRDLGAKGRIRE